MLDLFHRISWRLVTAPISVVLTACGGGAVEPADDSPAREITCDLDGEKLSWPIELRRPGYLWSQDYAQFNAVERDRYHTGFDLGGSVVHGDPVLSAGAGCAVMVQMNDATVSEGRDHGYGNTVIVKHVTPNGVIFSHYSHMEAVDEEVLSECRAHDTSPELPARLECGDVPVPVTRTTKLGTVGCTRGGLAECNDTMRPHVHFEVKAFATLYAVTGEYGYTTQLPDELGYVDPVVWLHQVESLEPGSLPLFVAETETGVAMRVGPSTSYQPALSKTLETGDTVEAVRSGPETEGCDAGWFEVRPPTSEMRFQDPTRGRFAPQEPAEFPTVWVCGGDDGEVWLDDEPVLSLTGIWEGTWTSERGGGGDVKTVLKHEGRALQGEALITESPCILLGDVSGSVEPAKVVFGVLGAEGEVQFTATDFASDHLTGAYHDHSSGPCAGDSGTFAVERTDAPIATLAGTWEGTWSGDAQGGGVATLVLEQDEAVLTGEAYISDSACQSGGSVGGSVDPLKVVLDVVSGEDTIRLLATDFNGGAIAGTFSITSGVCRGVTGTFALMRASGAEYGS